MRFLSLIFLLLSAPALAVSVPAEVAFFSLCGSFDPVSRALSVGEAGTVIVSRTSPAPEEGGRFCFRGQRLTTGTRAAPSWVFEAKGFQPAPETVKYPVLVCATVEKDFSTRWNNERLWFRGPFPRKGGAFGWCGDAAALPVRIENGWYLENLRFREAPDPYKRSGMSIGNQ